MLSLVTNDPLPKPDFHKDAEVRLEQGIYHAGISYGDQGFLVLGWSDDANLAVELAEAAYVR